MESVGPEPRGAKRRQRGNQDVTGLSGTDVQSGSRQRICVDSPQIRLSGAKSGFFSPLMKANLQCVGGKVWP